MSFKSLFIGFVLISLFAVAMINFSVNLSSDNNSNNSIVNEPTGTIRTINKSLSTNLSSFQTISQGQRSNFESDLPILNVGTLIIFAIISSGKIFTGMITGLFSIMLFPLATLIGIPPIFLGAFISIFLVTVILLMWRVLKGGQ